jgi:hypothetical protein
MDERRAADVPERRNFLAYLALFLIVLSWTVVGARVLSVRLGLVVSLVAMACAAGGLASIRTRGEAPLAIAVFGFSLALPALYALLYLMFGLVPDGSGWDD